MTSNAFNGVQVFSATVGQERTKLGERFDDWRRNRQNTEIVDIIIQQSSDTEFHCLTLVVFYRS